MSAFNNTKNHDRKHKLKVLPVSFITFPKIKSKVKTKGVFLHAEWLQPRIKKKKIHNLSVNFLLLPLRRSINHLPPPSTGQDFHLSVLCDPHTLGSTVLVYWFFLAPNLNNKKGKKTHLFSDYSITDSTGPFNPSPVLSPVSAVSLGSA